MRGANIPFVRRERDRHGNVRLYFQASRRARKIRIRADEGTPAFFAEYQQLLAATPERPIQRGPVSGTWRWLCVEYFRSPAYKRLDERTQRVRKGILEHTFDERIHPEETQTFGTVRVQDLTTKALKVLRDRKSTADLPEAA